MIENKKIKKSVSEGSGHWIAQRVTAIANIFFSIWFAYSVVLIVVGSIENARIWLAMPFNAIVMILMLGNIFYHGTLGIRVVVEDYIHCNCTKYTILLATVFAGFAAVVTGIFAVFQIYASVNF